MRSGLARHFARNKGMKERPIRWVFCILMIFGLAPPAFAADLDALRGSVPIAPMAPVMTVGPATFTRWSGFYFGGQFNYSGENTSFPQGMSLLPGSFLPQTTPSVQLLGNTNGNAVGAIGYGGFVGYNTQ